MCVSLWSWLNWNISFPPDTSSLDLKAVFVAIYNQVDH